MQTTPFLLPKDFPDLLLPLLLCIFWGGRRGVGHIRIRRGERGNRRKPSFFSSPSFLLGHFKPPLMVLFSWKEKKVGSRCNNTHFGDAYRMSHPLSLNTDLSPLFCAAQTDTPSPYTVHSLRFLFLPNGKFVRTKVVQSPKVCFPFCVRRETAISFGFLRGSVYFSCCCRLVSEKNLSATMQVLLSFVMSLLRPEHRYWLVLLLRFLQRILDSCLSFLCGYRTAQGWDRDVIRAGRSYAFSAQVVRGKNCVLGK